KYSGTKTLNPYTAYFTPGNLGSHVKEEAYYFDWTPEPDAIEDITALGSVEVEGIYDATGKKLPRMQKGLNILKMSNGTTLKLFVK
ncbi:MAG: hypothetical protein IK084_05765, partial [Bacteroidaceae bacterium]|nr:hypothetical protein [Bacteroidaceae bacterium]